MRWSKAATLHTRTSGYGNYVLSAVSMRLLLQNLSIPDTEPQSQALSTTSNSADDVKDGGCFLWDTLMAELSQDESGLKHRLVVLDNVAKTSNELHTLAERTAETYIMESQTASLGMAARLSQWRCCIWCPGRTLHPSAMLSDQ